MQANKCTLSDILAADIRLVAPLFQRPYVWNEEANWEPLWRAVVEVAEKRLEGVAARPYFMGAIVLDNLRGPIGAVPIREIIDGQQRMTTLQILMEASKSVMTGAPDQIRLLERITRNIQGTGTDQQYKVWPTNVDRDAFRSVMEGKHSSGLMHDARKFFEKRLSMWIGEGANPDLRMAAFVQGLVSDLVFVAIALDRDDDGQLIFETLNSLGAPLLPSDLVKNLLFRAAQTEQLDTDHLYGQYWRQFEVEGSFWREKVEVGRRVRSRLDIFLQHYLVLHIGRESQAAHQFRDYRDRYLDGSFGGVEAALEDFSRLAGVYKAFDGAKGIDPLGRVRSLLKALDQVLPVPLVLGAIAYSASDSERDAMLIVLESYIVRRVLGGAGSRNLSRIVSDLVTKLNAQGWSAENMASALKELRGNSSAWFEDEHIFWRLTNRSVYYDIKSTALSYIFSCLENAERNDYSEEAFRIGRPVQIEHVMPQKWVEHWPLPEGEVAELTATRNEHVQRIGNLTILTGPLNLSVSNAGWEEKKSRYPKDSRLSLNHRIAAHSLWNEETIAARSRDLAEQFCKLWPR